MIAAPSKAPASEFRRPHLSRPECSIDRPYWIIFPSKFNLLEAQGSGDGVSAEANSKTKPHSQEWLCHGHTRLVLLVRDTEAVESIVRRQKHHMRAGDCNAGMFRGSGNLVS